MRDEGNAPSKLDNFNCSANTVNINEHLSSYISTSITNVVANTNISDSNANDITTVNSNVESRMELDSHANMPVLGNGAYILGHTGQTADVTAYSPEYESMQIPIVDAAVQYNCPYNVQSHILILRNALYVPAMKNHLIPPFMMREAGIKVNNTPKIHLDDPDKSEHSVYIFRV